MITYSCWDYSQASIPKLQRWSLEWINNFIPHFTSYMISYPCWDNSQSMLVKGVPEYSNLNTIGFIWIFKLLLFNLFASAFLRYSHGRHVCGYYQLGHSGLSLCKVSFQTFCKLTHWGRDEVAAIFADDIFMCIFLSENFWISNKISLKYVPCGLVDNKLSLVRMMGCHRTGNKPLSEPTVA